MEKAARDPKNWDLVFPLAIMGYRISVQASVGHCPFKLMHGRDPVLPILFKNFAPELDINEEADWSLNDTAEHLMQTMTTLEELHKDALKNLEKAQKKNKLDFNKRVTIVLG
jgi:hypothetical protein